MTPRKSPPKPQLCNDDKMCASMTECVEADSFARGIIRLQYVDLKTGEDTGVAVCYRPKRGKKTRPYAFRACPFCGEPVNQWILNRPENQ